MHILILLKPCERFITDISKKDRNYLASELESDNYPQGHKDLMYDAGKWSPLGVWEWCNGWKEEVIDGYKTPLEAEINSAFGDKEFYATKSNGLYIESLPLAKVIGITVPEGSYYDSYDRSMNMSDLRLSQVNDVFEAFIHPREEPENLLGFSTTISFHKIAGLLRGKEQTLVLELISP